MSDRRLQWASPRSYLDAEQSEIETWVENVMCEVQTLKVSVVDRMA